MRPRSKRVEGWTKIIPAIIDAVRDYKLNVGQHDCITLACFVETSISQSPKLIEVFGKKGTYSNDEEGIEVFGFDTPWDLMDHYLEPCEVLYAQTGDIMGLENPNGQKILGINCDSKIAVITEDGLSFVKSSHAKKAWVA